MTRGRGSVRYRRWWMFAVVFLVLLWTGGAILLPMWSGSGDPPGWALPVVMLSLVLSFLIDHAVPAEPGDREDDA